MNTSRNTAGARRGKSAAAVMVLAAVLAAGVVLRQQPVEAQQGKPARTGVAGPLPILMWDLNNDGFFDWLQGEGDRFVSCAFMRTAFTVPPAGADTTPRRARLTFAVSAEDAHGSLYYPPGHERPPGMPAGSRPLAIGWVDVPAPPGHTSTVDLKPTNMAIDDGLWWLHCAVYVNGARVAVQTDAGPASTLRVQFNDKGTADTHTQVYAECSASLTIYTNNPVAATMTAAGGDPNSACGDSIVSYEWDFN